MIKHEKETINKKFKIGNNSYNVEIKVLHNFDTPQITMKVNSDESFLNMEVVQLELYEVHTALNEIMRAFSTITGLPMTTSFPVPAGVGHTL